MNRPAEYENLLRTHTFKVAVSSPDSIRLHDVRNRVTYRQPIPPITKSDAEALQIILDDMLAAAKLLVGID